MTEKAETTPPVLPVELRFEGSAELKGAVQNLIKPELHHAFAERSFYLYLWTKNRVELPAGYHTTEQLTDAEKMLEGYNLGLAKDHKGRAPYNTQLPLVPAIGHYEYAGETKPGSLVLFKLALGQLDYEKEKLFAPPFNVVDQRRPLVGHWLPEKTMIERSEREVAYEDINERMGASNANIQRLGRAFMKYHVKHPIAIPGQIKWSDKQNNRR